MRFGRGLFGVQEGFEGVLILAIHFLKKLSLERLVFFRPRIFSSLSAYGHRSGLFEVADIFLPSLCEQLLPLLNGRCEVPIEPWTNAFVVMLALIQNKDTLSGGLLSGSVCYRGNEILCIGLR